MNPAEKMTGQKYSAEDIAGCIDLLKGLTEDSEQLAYLSAEQRVALLTAAGQLSRPGRDEIRKRKRDIKHLRRRAVVKSERRARAATGAE